MSQVLALGCALLACAAAQAPALAPTSPDACGACSYPSSGTLEAAITFQNVADTARFYSPGSDGSILVFFDVLVTFTHPPANLSAQDFTVPSGAHLHCTQLRHVAGG